MAEKINPFTGRRVGWGHQETLKNATNAAVRREAQQGLLDASRQEEDMLRLAPLIEAQRIERISQERAAEKQDRLNQEIQAAQRSALQAGGPNMSAIDARERMNAARENILAREQRAPLSSVSAADMQQPNAMGGLSYGGPPPSLPQLPGESAAAYYMRTRAAERAIASDMRQPNALGGPALPPAPAQPSDATTAGLKLGNGVGDNNRERSFLERMARSGLLSTLQGMARAERMYGVGPLAAFSESALDVQAARSAADQKKAEAQLELDKERIKAQPKPPKPTPEITNLYKEMGVYQSGLNTFNRIKSILSKSIATGAVGSTLAGLNNIAAAFNINLSPDAQTSVNKAVAEIRTQLIASKAYGREANKDEQKLIRALIPEAGTFKTIKELEQAYETAAASMQRKANETNAIMTGVYGLRSYGTVVPSSPLFTRPNQGK